jgi:hypothetical protein
VAEFQPALSARIWPYWRCNAVRAGYGIMSPTARAQQFVPERERVFSGGHDAGAYRLLDRGQQRGRCLADHFGRVFQTERGAEHRRGHRQVSGPFAEPIGPALCDTVHSVQQPSGNQIVPPPRQQARTLRLMVG